jgi:predicted aconitase
VEHELHLTQEERSMLAGESGVGTQRAMEILVALARIYGAQDLVPVASVQVSGVSYKNLGDAGLQFIQEWVRGGARVRVPTTLNPAGLDLLDWRELGFPEDFALRQQAVLDAYGDLGITTTCTCTPYLVGHLPAFGQHVAWAESSAVSYVNSIVGARTNREGGPSALAAAIAGRTPRYGLHLDQNRRPSAVVEVLCDVQTEAEWGALGYLVGKSLGAGIPLLRLQGQEPQSADLRALGAAMAASGAVALYHIEGLTPEAKLGVQPVAGAIDLAIDDLSTAYEALDGHSDEIDIVSLGCPHASLDQLRAVAERLRGRRLRAELWITTSREVQRQARELGILDRIRDFGARVVADTCLVVAPIKALGHQSLATNSAKMAVYTPSHSGLLVRFGSLEQCLHAAETGRWPPADPAASSRTGAAGQPNTAV